MPDYRLEEDTLFLTYVERAAYARLPAPVATNDATPRVSNIRCGLSFAQPTTVGLRDLGGAIEICAQLASSGRDWALRDRTGFSFPPTPEFAGFAALGRFFG
ncbi:hypothetical protein NHJ13734_009868, partial [Beauveria thailandica]